MKEAILKIRFTVLALAAVLFEVLLWSVLFPVMLLWKMYEKIRYEAQCLRCPPPTGGMFSEMGRRIGKSKSE